MGASSGKPSTWPTPMGHQLQSWFGADATDAAPRTRIGWRQVDRPEEEVTLFQWSPDGKHIAFVAHYYGEPHRLYVANSDTSEVQQLLDLSTILEAEQYHRHPMYGYYGSIRGIAWSPDGSQISIEVGGNRLVGDTLKPRSQLFAVPTRDSASPLLLQESDDAYIDSYFQWPALLARGLPHVFRGVLFNYQELMDSLSVVRPTRIVRYAVGTGPNVWPEVEGWVLTAVPWDGSGEKVLVRTAGNRLVAARPRQEDTSADDRCSEDQVVPDAQQNPGLVRDCRVLLRMRDTLAGDGVLYWSTDSPIQEWPGVVVAGSPPRVHALVSVPGALVAGSIPPEISELSELRELDLQGHSLRGSIPSALGRLDKLERLNLSGGFPQQELGGVIPRELGNLENLKFLDLSRNSFGSIPSELGQLSNLEELILDFNPLTGPLPPALGRPQETAGPESLRRRTEADRGHSPRTGQALQPGDSYH